MERLNRAKANQDDDGKGNVTISLPSSAKQLRKMAKICRSLRRVNHNG